MILYYTLVVTLPLISQRILAYQIGGFTVEKYLGAACALYALGAIPSRGTVPQIFKTLQAKTFFVLFLLLSLSYFTRALGIVPIDILLIYVSHFIFLVTTVILVDSLPRLRWACLAAVGSIGLAALYVLREWQGGSQVYGSGYRGGSVTGDPNYYTASAVLCLPLALHLAQEKRPKWQRIFCLGVILLALAGVMVAASRGGFIGLIVAALVYIWQSPKRLRNLLVVSIVVIAFVIFAPSSPLERFLNPSKSDVESQDVRLVLWQAGLEMVREYPLGGIGLGTFKTRILDYAPPGFDAQYLAHNTYLEIAAEAGIPAFVAFVGLFIFSWLSLNRVCRETRDAGPQLVYRIACSIQAGLLGFAICIFFISAEFLKLFWFMVFISACLPAILRSAAAESSMGQFPAPVAQQTCVEPRWKRV